MRKLMVLAVAVAALVGVLPLADAGAAPSGGSPVTININFTGGSPVSGTFTASGAFCPSGTATETGNGSFRITTLTCDNASGSIALHFAQYGNDGLPAKWQVRKNEGTGSYVNMSGGGDVTLDNCGTFPCQANLAGTLG
jgi:hypothetical protein